jgi:type II secretory pathway pseudopilin PulG
LSLLSTVNCQLSTGFTLVETMVAISLLTIAIVAPMSLTTQSLSSAYYARDQITAFHLAQEAIESIRHARDRNVLKNALGITEANGDPINLLKGFPANLSKPFTIDTTTDAMNTCSGTCPALKKTPEGLYNYSSGTVTPFVRSINATFINNGTEPQDEIRLTVTVTWQSGSLHSRSFVISNNLYRWVNDGTGAR